MRVLFGWKRMEEHLTVVSTSYIIDVCMKAVTALFTVRFL